MAYAKPIKIKYIKTFETKTLSTKNIFCRPKTNLPIDLDQCITNQDVIYPL